MKYVKLTPKSGLMDLMLAALMFGAVLIIFSKEVLGS